MSYEESLRQAWELLSEEIAILREQLEMKEISLKKLESFIKEPYRKEQYGGSLTQSIVKVLYNLTRENQVVTAKQVVKEFRKQRSDVNESTIRSTLYQVSRKQKPTVIDVDGQNIPVYVIKNGPTYNIEIANDQQEGFIAKANI